MLLLYLELLFGAYESSNDVRHTLPRKGVRRVYVHHRRLRCEGSTRSCLEAELEGRKVSGYGYYYAWKPT